MREPEYPYIVARSTGSENESNSALLASILVASTLDEISNIEDFSGVERYIRNQGRSRVSPDEGGGSSEKTTSGLMFWVYPTCLHGPFHKRELGRGEREIKLHGTLVVIERGVRLADAMRMIREEFRDQGIGHLHIAKNQI